MTISVARARNQRSPSIDRRRVRERDAVRRDFEIRLLEHETIEDCLKPEYLGLSADRFSAGDRVTLVAHDLSWWAELLVVETDVALSAVKVVLLLGPVDLQSRIAAAQPFDTSKIVVEQVNDAWRLRHGSKVLTGGFRSKSDAQKHLNEIRDGRKVSAPSP